MTDTARSKVQPVTGDGNYCRIYVPSAISLDSRFPFRPNHPVRLEIVETACGRDALVVVDEQLELDPDTEIVLAETTKDIQVSLDDDAGGSA